MKLYISIITGLLISSISLAQTGQIRGKVVDANNNEPVPFANILIYGTQTGTTSDFDGNFILTGLEPGFVKLQISFVGYKTKLSDDIMLSNNNVPYIEINLEPTDQQIEEVVVKVNPFQKMREAPLAMQRIGSKEIESNPGSNRDVSRVIQSFPGVGSTPAFRNDVIIRGGSPSENRFFLDGVEIPILNHFSTQGASGGPIGIINADFIQSIDYYSGSFPANKYNALSGMFDFKQKEGSKDKTNFQVSVGASEAAFTIDGPMGKKTDYIFSVRRSYLQFLFSALELPFLPTFTDYQFKLKTNLDEKNQLTIVSIGSYDKLRLNTDLENPDPSQEYNLSQIPVNNQWSYTIGAVYKHFFDKGFHTLVLSRNMLDNQFYKYPDNNEEQEKIFDYQSQEQENKLRYEVTLNNNGFKYNFGANMEYADYFNATTQQVYLDDSLRNFQYESTIDLFKYGLSGQVSKRFFESRLLVSLGVRFDGSSYNNDMANLFKQISPRLSFSYSLTDKTLLNAGLGRYFQLPAYTTLGFRDSQGQLLNENSSKYTGVNQYNLGIEQRFSQSVLLSVEGFYKDYFQYPIDLITGASLANQGANYSSVVGAAPVTFTGAGEAYGFEVLNRLNFDKFTMLASYTFVRSLFTDINNTLIPSSWDSKHLLTVTGSKEFKGNWRAGFKWRFVGGLPYTPYDLETSSYVDAWNAKGSPYLDYSQLNAERLKSFYQLDLRVDKNFFFPKWAFMLYVDIQNILNFKYQGQDYIVREKNPDGTYMTINNGTQYVLNSVPNESGTILPTLGVMFKF